MIMADDRYTKYSIVKVLNMEEKILHKSYKDIFPRRYEQYQVEKQLKTAHPSFYAIYMRKPLNDD